MHKTRHGTRARSFQAFSRHVISHSPSTFTCSPTPNSPNPVVYGFYGDFITDTGMIESLAIKISSSTQPSNHKVGSSGNQPLTLRLPTGFQKVTSLTQQKTPSFLFSQEIPRAWGAVSQKLWTKTKCRWEIHFGHLNDQMTKYTLLINHSVTPVITPSSYPGVQTWWWVQANVIAALLRRQTLNCQKNALNIYFKT